MLHYERNRRSGLAAGEAFEYLLGRRHAEGRVLVLVERAEAEIVRAATLQGDEIPYPLFDARGVENPVDRSPVNHSVRN